MTRSEWVKEGWKTRRQRYGDNGGIVGPPRIQFCPKGHDTFLTGRGKSGGCKVCTRAAHLRWRKNNPEKMREVSRRSDLKMSYGLTPEKWQKMFEAQKGRCAICDKHQSHFKTKLCVDHNHSTGKVRGLLCPSCNHLLIALENKKFCLNATLYLEKYI